MLPFTLSPDVLKPLGAFFCPEQIMKQECNVITLRTRESLCLDLDDAYLKIEKLKREVNTWKEISSLAAREIEELRNRRD